jgi:8-oxo-dGTP pyrophosphatase MutT (NUDIX family)
VFRSALPLMLVAGLGLALPDPATGQQPDQEPASPETVVSPDRVSEGLRRPELQIPAVPQEMPTFRSSVTGDLETALAAMRRELQEEARLHPAGQYKTGVDLWPAVTSLVKTIKRIRYEHSEEEARQMVQDELSTFCAEHDCAQAAQLPLEGVILPH